MRKRKSSHKKASSARHNARQNHEAPTERVVEGVQKVVANYIEDLILLGKE